MDIYNNTLAGDHAPNATIDKHIYPTNGPVIIIVCVLTTLFILGANIFALVFLCTIKDRKLRNRVSMILNLTYSDIIIGIVAFMLIFKLCKESLFADYACWLFMFLLEFGLAASLFQTFCICLERYLAVQGISTLKNLFAERRGRNILLIVLWIVIALFFGSLKVFSSNCIELCTYPNLYGQHYGTVLKITMFGVYTPLLLGTIILYLLTLIKLTKIIRKRSANNMFSTSNKMNKADIEVKGKIIETKEQKESHAMKNFKITETPEDRQMLHDKQVQEVQTNVLSSEDTAETKYYDDQTCSNSSSASGNLEIQRQNSKSPNGDLLESRVVLENNKIRTKTVKNKNTSKPGIKFKLKAIKTVGFIVLALTLSTGTGIILLIVETLCSHCTIDKQIRTFTTLTWFLNSSINPMIYIFAIKEFRESVKKLFNLQFLYK